VNVFLPVRQGEHVLPSRLAAVAASLAFVVIAPPVRAASPLAATEHSAKVPPAGAHATSPPAKPPGTIDDLVLRPGGVLEGRVLCPENRADGSRVAGLPVALLRAAETVATTVTDAQGKFAFGNLRGGLYRVLISAAEEPRWRFCRLWTADAAPPHASDRLSVLVGGRLTRGQSPLPIGRLPQAATIVAIAAGAFLPPIIYHAVNKDDYIPASP
jgi:hypothetical protein